MSQMSGPPQQTKGYMPSHCRAVFTKKWLAHPRPKNAIYRCRQLDMRGFQMQGGMAVFCDVWQDDRMDKRREEFEEKEKRGERVILLAHGVIQSVGLDPGEVSPHASECNPLIAEAPRFQESGNQSIVPEEINPPGVGATPRVLYEHSPCRSTLADCDSLRPLSSASAADCTELFAAWSNGGLSMQEPARSPQAALDDADTQYPVSSRTTSSADLAQRPDVLLDGMIPTLVERSDDATSCNNYQADLTEARRLSTDGKLQGKGLDYWAHVLENRAWMEIEPS